MRCITSSAAPKVKPNPEFEKTHNLRGFIRSLNKTVVPEGDHPLVQNRVSPGVYAGITSVVRRRSARSKSLQSLNDLREILLWSNCVYAIGLVVVSMECTRHQQHTN